MTAERIEPDCYWPATITVGEGYYGLRIDTDHGSEVLYVSAATIQRTASLPVDDLRVGGGDRPERDGRNYPAHRGATCEAA